MESLSAKDLYEYLLELRDILEAAGEQGMAQDVYFSSRFASGSTSELFGEARIALTKILDDVHLSAKDRERLVDVLDGINNEFDRISRG